MVDANSYLLSRPGRHYLAAKNEKTRRMTLPEIVARMQKGLDRHPISDRLKFDCGADGVITLADGQARLIDKPADCTIRISAKNLAKLIQGQLNPMTAFALGKIKVSGDMSVAMRLGQLLK